MTPTGVFLLGPNEWDDDYKPETPIWLREYLDDLPPSATPKDIRKALAKQIADDSGGKWNGVVMTPESQRKNEDDALFFERLERDVQAYFILVPLRAKILGTVFEGGMLRRDFKWGGHPRISIFIEKGFVRTDEDGVVTIEAKGKRTTYIKTLLKVADHVEEWETLEEAFDQMRRRARAMSNP